MATEILYPASDSVIALTRNTGANNYGCVNTSDGATSHVSNGTSTNFLADYYTMTAFVGPGTITNIEAFAVVSEATSVYPGHVELGFKIGVTEYITASQLIPSAYQYTTFGPATSSYAKVVNTVADTLLVVKLSSGYDSVKNWYLAYCTFLYCVVTFTPSGGGWVNISKVNGITSASISKVNGIAVANISKINGIAV